MLASCTGQKWTETQTEEGFNVITQKRGQTLGYTPGSGVNIITDKGYAFKDLNRNGSLDVYEDWRLPAEVRAEDLAQQLTIEEIAGLMLYSSHQSVPSGGGMFGGDECLGAGAADEFIEAGHISCLLSEKRSCRIRWGSCRKRRCRRRGRVRRQRDRGRASSARRSAPPGRRLRCG